MTKRAAGFPLHTEVKGLSSMPSKYPSTGSSVGQVQYDFFDVTRSWPILCSEYLAGPSMAHPAT